MQLAARYVTSPGEPHPLGASVCDGGVNFSLYSRSATCVELLLFDRLDDESPKQIVRLDPRVHRTLRYWHVFVHGIGNGQIYGYRVHGPHAPREGSRFDPDKVLLDPYARAIVYGDERAHEEACRPGANIRTAMKSLVVDIGTYDWKGVERPHVDPQDRIIYEMHVRGFTRHPSAGVAHPGTFSGLTEKIAYLKDLGVTTVELLPVFQFDEHELPFVNPRTGERLLNYWGYNPLGFFSAHRGYYIEDWRHMRYLTGFRDMVRELHANGLEVFLDVVFNHTGEGDEHGPTLSFRGIENSVYYLLDPSDKSRYANYSGTGNTVSCNHPIVRRLILDSLRYWVEVMHVDGFRFDLAAVLSRDEQGRPMQQPPLPWEIEADPVLQRTHLIAEAWDAGGLYQVGEFPGERWSEWNGKFRDDVRRFWRGDLGHAGAFASRLLGSPDLYERHGREVTQCVNFVTCHDGFTLNDLVSYARKHNEDNGEGGADGSDSDWSHNYGVEGPTTDPGIEQLRSRQIKNLLTTLFVSQGTPMLLGGDEFRRTQGGNNNAYCQDNEVSWFDWGLLDRYAEIHRFTRAMIRFRRAHPSLRRRRYLQGIEASRGSGLPGYPRVRWHGLEVDEPDWEHACRTVSVTLTEAVDDVAIHMMFNAHEHALRFELPPPSPGRRWWRVVDTARPTPEDIHEPGREVPVDAVFYELSCRCAVVLIER
jgi:isoamylase